MFAAVRYGEVVALLKTRMAGLFPESWYRALCEVPTEAAVLKQLQDGGIPLMADDRLPTKQWLLMSWLVPDYRSVWLRLPRSARPVIRAWLDRLELENVKYAVRSLASGERIRPDALIDVGSLASLPISAFRDLTHLADLEAAVRHTSFEAPLRATAHRLREDQGVFVIEAALDRHLYRTLLRTAERYRGPGAAALRRLTIQFMVALALMWTIRYRFSYNLPAEAILGLATTGSTGTLADLVHRAMAAGSDEDVHALLTEVAGSSTREQTEPRESSDTSAFGAWERRLWHAVYRTATVSLLGTPFGLSVIVALLILKELAIRDIAVICQGRAMALSPDALKPLLIHG